MKKSQLNAISRSYTQKRNSEALKIIEARGLVAEYRQSKKTAVQFLTYYRTPEQKEAAKAAAKAKAAERRALLKANGVKTVAELKAKQDAEQYAARIAYIKQAIASGEYRIAKSGNAVDKNNKVVAYAHELN